MDLHVLPIKWHSFDASNNNEIYQVKYLYCVILLQNLGQNLHLLLPATISEKFILLLLILGVLVRVPNLER